MAWKKLNKQVDSNFLRNNDVKIIYFPNTPNMIINIWHYNHSTNKLEDSKWDDCIMKKSIAEINNAQKFCNTSSWDYENAKVYYKPNEMLQGYHSHKTPAKKSAKKFPKLNVESMF